MKCLVVGLGSMGKRRIRCLQALGFKDIIGFDTRADRRNEATSKYGISVIDDYKTSFLDKKKLLIVSTPPNMHLEYASDAIKRGIPCFIEASVLPKEVSGMISLLRTKKSYVAPSCTLKFHPIICRIQDIVQSGELGSVTNFSYHCGQYLPDWHPWENVKDYYVSVRETGGAREIVPFELTWITGIFGFPCSVKGYFDKTSKMDIAIEDTYAFSLKFPGFIGNVVVDVVSRFATRSLILNLESGQIRWNWEENAIRIYDRRDEKWKFFHGNTVRAEEGYNKNIIEDMYIAEIRSFIEGMNDPDLFPNNPANDLKVLQLLEQIENSDGGFYRKLQ